MSEVTLVRCVGCRTPLGKDPPSAAMIEHAATCPEHPLAKRLADAEAAKEAAERARDAARHEAHRLLRHHASDDVAREFADVTAARDSAEMHLAHASRHLALVADARNAAEARAERAERDLTAKDRAFDSLREILKPDATKHEDLWTRAAAATAAESALASPVTPKEPTDG